MRTRNKAFARGVGYGPARAKALRQNANIRVLLRETPEDEMGVRPWVSRFLGLERDSRFDGDRVRIFRHMARLRLVRDRETGELPFGEW